MQEVDIRVHLQDVIQEHLGKIELNYLCATETLKLTADTRN